MTSIFRTHDFKIKDKPSVIIPNSDTTINKMKNKVTTQEQYKSIQDNLKNHEDDLHVKFLILINEKEHKEKLIELIGPVFKDITLSEDECDPVTFDPIWEYKDGKKVPGSVNKHYLFSYIDSKNKIRCFTVFTLKDMVNEENFVHPITGEEIPEKDIKRARELISLYDTKLSLFGNNNLNELTDFKIKNITISLFKKLNKFSIYLEESWFTDIEDTKSFVKILKETSLLFKNNSSFINNDKNIINKFKIKTNIKNIDSNKNKLRIKKYILDKWKEMLSLTDNEDNQVAAWIIVSSLSCVVPEIKKKYPDLEIYNN